MIPQHIGIILDGNRRFAKQLMLKPWMGHKWGLEKARHVIEWACEAGVKYFTAYVLSLENLKTRPKRELAFILKYLAMETDNILECKDHVVHRFGIKVRFIGRLRMLPKWMQKKLSSVEKATAHYKQHFLNVAVAYGGQQEIVDATKSIVKKIMGGALSPADINEDLMKKHLYTNGQPYPDMILRTGGEKRLSNFLPFQSAYSELIFTDKKWPELTKRNFSAAMREFDNRQRRFGK